MKKALATASVAMVLAAMPVAGVFATVTGNSPVDEISVTIDPTCSIARGNKGADNSEHTKGTGFGDWETDSNNALKDTISGTIVADTVYSIGSSNFTVKCNNANGWSVSASANALSGAASGNTATIPVGTPSTTASAWSFTPTSNEEQGGYSITVGAANAATVAQGVGTVIATNPTTQYNAATGNSGVSFNVAYSVSAAYDIPTDTYTGTITYTLAELQ